MSSTKQNEELLSTTSFKISSLSRRETDILPISYVLLFGVYVMFKTFCLDQASWLLCERWRSMDRRGDYNDVYDGQIWKDFQTVHGTNLLSHTILQSYLTWIFFSRISI